MKRFVRAKTHRETVDRLENQLFQYQQALEKVRGQLSKLQMEYLNQKRDLERIAAQGIDMSNPSTFIAGRLREFNGTLKEMLEALNNMDASILRNEESFRETEAALVHRCRKAVAAAQAVIVRSYDQLLLINMSRPEDTTPKSTT